MTTVTTSSPESRSPSRTNRFEVAPPGGAKLVAYEHAAGAPRGLVVVLGAMATPSRFYATLADHLASRGLTTIRFDYRGIGDSRHGRLRDEHAGVLDWTVGDVDAAIASARARHPRLPLALLGHSLGGQSIGLSLRAHEAKAVVLVASQSGWVGHWEGAARVRMEMMWRVLVPAMTGAFGYLPSWTGIGEDVPARVAREWASWCTTKGYVTGARPASELRYAMIACPVLAWSFTDDDYAPRGSTDELLSWLVRARLEHRRVRPQEIGSSRIGHFGFFRRGASALWDDTAEWLLRALAEQPS